MSDAALLEGAEAILRFALSAGSRTRGLEHPAAVQAEEWRYDHWRPRSHVGGVGAGLAAATGPRAVEAREEPELPQPFNTYGIAPGGNIDQTPSLQEAADKAAASATPFFLPPGNYTTSKLTLKSGTRDSGHAGRVGAALCRWRCDHRHREGRDIRLTGLTLAGEAKPIDGGGLLIAESVKA